MTRACAVFGVLAVLLPACSAGDGLSNTLGKVLSVVQGGCHVVDSIPKWKIEDVDGGSEDGGDDGTT